MTPTQEKRGAREGTGKEKEEQEQEQQQQQQQQEEEEEEEEEEERALLIRVTRGAGEPPSKRSSTG
jgi:hypothetical protein